MDFTSYVRALGAAVILCALLDLLAPEGSFKKYCRLAGGFVVIAAMLAPLTTGFSLEGWDAASADEAMAQARARVLAEHRRNLEAITEARFPGCKAFVEVDGEGNVTSLTIEGPADREAAEEYAKELNLDGDRVKINGTESDP